MSNLDITRVRMLLDSLEELDREFGLGAEILYEALASCHISIDKFEEALGYGIAEWIK